MTSSEEIYYNPHNRFANPTTAFVGEPDPVAGDGMIAYAFTSGQPEFQLFGVYRVLAAGRLLYSVRSNGQLEALDAGILRAEGRRTDDAMLWSVPCTNRVYSFIKAGEALIAGCRGSIEAFGA
jgi:hypothetical protein